MLANGKLDFLDHDVGIARSTGKRAACRHGRSAGPRHPSRPSPWSTPRRARRPGAAGRDVVSVGLLLALALITGVEAPPISSVLRTLYPRLLRDRPDLVPAAFALDSVLTELLFALGPLSCPRLSSSATPASRCSSRPGPSSAGPRGSSPCCRRASARTRPRTRSDRRGGVAGALASPALRVLTATMLPVGICFGMLEVVVPRSPASTGIPRPPACCSPSGDRQRRRRLRLHAPAGRRAHAARARGARRRRPAVHRAAARRDLDSHDGAPARAHRAAHRPLIAMRNELAGLPPCRAPRPRRTPGS